MDSNIYLIPTDNGYRAEAAFSLPTHDAILLTKEREYPVSFWAKRTSKNLQTSIHYDCVHSRDELLCKLNRLGKECATIHKIWDYYGSYVRDEDLDALFEKCVQIKKDAYDKAKSEALV